MIKVQNIAEAKQTFKKLFKNDCSDSFTVVIDVADKILYLSTLDSFNNVRRLEIPLEEVNYVNSNIKRIILSTVHRLDVLWDFIWDKDGFWMETYKDTYPDILSKSKKHGTEYTMAQIVFRTKKKEYSYYSWESYRIQVIELTR